MSGVALTAAPPAGAQRVSLRVVEDGQARDVVGWVLGTDGDDLVVLPADAGPQWVPKSAIEARRAVGPRVVRPASTPLDLARLTVHGWPGVERFRLGGWLLRASDGWTARANSCLVAGDPGVPTAEAFVAVSEFYRHRNLPPQLQIIVDENGAPIEKTRSPGPTVAEVDAFAAAQGWQASPETFVLVRDEAPIVAPEIPAPIRAIWADEPSPRWQSLLRAGEGADPRVYPVLTAAPARYVTLLDGSTPVAIGRGATAEDWLGISCIEVQPDHRHGLARLLTESLLADSPAQFSYLQVAADNAPALALYESLGFRLHHRYWYRTQVG